MVLLAFDIGARRTGVACFNDAVGFCVPLDTITAQTMDETVDRIHLLATERGAAAIVIGIPLLPSGAAGEQAAFVEEHVRTLRDRGLQVITIDERYTTTRERGFDVDGFAALELLRTHLRMQGVDNT